MNICSMIWKCLKPSNVVFIFSQFYFHLLLGVYMLQCTHFVWKLKLHIISKVATHNISFTLNYSKITYKWLGSQNKRIHKNCGYEIE
jgi:hypothetical protein